MPSLSLASPLSSSDTAILEMARNLTSLKSELHKAMGVCGELAEFYCCCSRAVLRKCKKRRQIPPTSRLSLQPRTPFAIFNSDDVTVFQAKSKTEKGSPLLVNFSYIELKPCTMTVRMHITFGQPS